MSEATTGVPAAKASVSTIPNDSPPSDGAHSTCARVSAARFSSSSTRPSAVTPRGSASSGDRASASTPITVSRAGTCSRSASKARSSTGRPLRSTAWPTNAISSGSPGTRGRGGGAPPSGSVTPLGTIRYSPPKKRRPVHSAASDTAIRTRRRFMLRLAPHSQATACGSRWCE